MSNNILLTGCYGFIGRHICDYLIKKKYKVYCVVKKKRKDKLNKRVKIIKYTNNLTKIFVILKFSRTSKS